MRQARLLHHRSIAPTGSAIRTIACERAALAMLEHAFANSALGASFDAVADCIRRSTGRVVTTGMGKSGLVARKIAATLASTGTPAFFIHPADASHGDLGMITPADVVITLSWSGETAELADIVSYCARFEIPLIAVTSRAASTLAIGADMCLVLPLVAEACPNKLAPTSSCIVQAALGDALAVALIEMRGFSSEDFRLFHPRGRLGAQLMRVQDVMSVGDKIPSVDIDATIRASVLETSLKRFGVTAIVDREGRLVGAFTDGDLRRSLSAADLSAPVRDVMNRQPLAVPPTMLLSEALAILTDRHITQLFICEDARLVGIVHLHDLLEAGVV